MAAAIDTKFVADGYERAEAAIRATVESEFAERREHSSFWERFKLRCEIELEVARRQEIQARRDALY